MQLFMEKIRLVGIISIVCMLISYVFQIPILGGISRIIGFICFGILVLLHLRKIFLKETIDNNDETEETSITNK